jgi:peptidoglycan/LPS O-acetylase OafA/YrhL
MEQIEDIKTPMRKVYRNNAIWVAAFFGGPLAAGYIMAENFKAFNEPQKAKITWIITVVATILIFACVIAIPDDVKFPNHLIPLIYTVIAYALMQSLQGKSIKNYISSGGHFFGWGRTICVGLISLAITLVVIAIFAFVMKFLSYYIQN